MSVNKRLISTGPSVDVGYTTWTKVQQMTGAGGSNSTTLTYTHPFYMLTDYTSATAYSNNGTNFTSIGITQSHGLFYAMGACLTDTNLYVVKGTEPLWPNNSYWKTANWYGSSMSTFTTVSGPAVLYGDLTFADIDGTGGYIYQLNGSVYPGQIRKYSPANLNNYTDIALGVTINNPGDYTTNSLLWDGFGWWVIYQRGVIWYTVKLSPDFQQEWVSEQNLGYYGGTGVGYIFGSSTLVGANTVYLKATGSDKVQEFTLS